MSLKKFSDFAENNKVSEACGKVNTKSKTTEKPKKPVKKEKKEEVVKESKDSLSQLMQNYKNDVTKKQHNNNNICERNGNFVNFLRITKPSDSFKFLNEYDSYKDVHYVMSEQPNNSISVFKYNKNEGVNMKEFADSLFIHYKKNEVLNRVLENSSIEGNELFVVFKNLPDEKFKNIVKKDLINLLKNK